MKATGVVRRLDNLGRVVLPIELRRQFALNEGDGVEIFVEDNTILLRKYEPACVFCGQMEGLSQYQGRQVCRCCRDTLGKMSA